MNMLTLGLKALGLRSRHCFIDFCRCFSCARLLKQLLQLQLLQNSPFAKQSQYLHLNNKKDTMSKETNVIKLEKHHDIV